MMFSIYILYSINYDKYYIGHSDDIDRRLKEHNKLSDKSFTSKFRPWELKAVIHISESRSDAMKIESYIKSQKRKSFIELVIQKQGDDEFKNWLKQNSSDVYKSSVG